MKLSDELALVDACLDDGMTMKEMVDTFRREEYKDTMSITDSIVYALLNSTHNKAPEVLRHIRNRITRYSNIKIVGDAA